jgi:hypothetical protein
VFWAIGLAKAKVMAIAQILNNWILATLTLATYHLLLVLLANAYGYQ